MLLCGVLFVLEIFEPVLVIEDLGWEQQRNCHFVCDCWGGDKGSADKSLEHLLRKTFWQKDRKRSKIESAAGTVLPHFFSSQTAQSPAVIVYFLIDDNHDKQKRSIH